MTDTTDLQMINVTDTTDATADATANGIPILAVTGAPIAIIDTYEATFIIVFIIRHIQFVLILVGNGIVLLAFKLYPDLRNATGWLISGLALSDLVGGFVPPLMVVLSFNRNSSTWINLCHIKLVLMVAYVLGNVIFTAIIALERLITLSYPLTYQNMITSYRAALAVAIVWGYISVFSLSLPFLNHDHLQTVEQVDCLTWNCFTTQVQLTFLTQVYVCTALIFIVYGLIGRIAWMKGKSAMVSTGASTVQWKITKMMGTVALIYGAFYVPLMIVDRVMRIYPHIKWITETYFYFSAMFMINSWINPILYVSKNPQIKTAIRKMLPTCIAKRVLPKIESI